MASKQMTKAERAVIRAAIRFWKLRNKEKPGLLSYLNLLNNVDKACARLAAERKKK